MSKSFLVLTKVFVSKIIKWRKYGGPLTFTFEWNSQSQVRHCEKTFKISTLQWRHNGRDSVSKTSLTIAYPTLYSDADQRKHQSSAWIAFVRVIHRWPVNSPHKYPVTRKMFPFEDVIMDFQNSGVIDSIYVCVFIKTHTYEGSIIFKYFYVLAFKAQL